MSETKFTRRRVLGSACALAASAALRAQTPPGDIRYPRVCPLPARLPLRPRRRCLRPPQRPHRRPAYARRPFATTRHGRGAPFNNSPAPCPSARRSISAPPAPWTAAGTRVEKIVYQSRPGLFVTANLYLPKSGTPPYPGVLFQMGHSANGKSYALYQRCCQGLVQLGYVVLAFDPIGQGERTNYPRPDGWLTRLRSPTEEHTVPGRQMLLVGETATGALLWDAMRSLDVLASHPKVDPRRLASTGQSGGGTLTMILAAMDDRLAAAAVSSGNTENFAVSPFLAPGSADDAEQDLVGSGPLAFDRWDLLWPIAPKPLLVAVSAHDFFGTYSPSYETSGREEFEKLRARLLHAGRGRQSAALRIAAAARALLSHAAGRVQLVRAIPEWHGDRAIAGGAAHQPRKG